ncbi:DUF6083 domain-containing protein [Streptomyces sp. SL13]|uniref:DUF6083 domain-containing protein n=1 Tax=Streptantibioticus silvisoli TaxID=2705255 RepID=A0AA90H9X1_9ACTN|nr:DUF6083 domain-containing protein [Streptantibioticus silvisoli]MDI5973981.1 DUF6083 domain-containing protein [Streptantibioticus silvisoli]
MRTTNNPGADGHRWDGSPKNYHPRRALRVATDSPTRLLRTAQRARCTSCGNLIEWYPHPGGSSIPLHPRELPAAQVPPPDRWHVSSGIAHPAGDGTDWCRIRHALLCPTLATNRNHPSPLLNDIHRAIALITRRLTDQGTLPHHPQPPTPPAPPTEPPPNRPVVRMLYVLYLAPAPVEQIHCVAYTRTRQRCPMPINTPNPTGTWVLLPNGPQRPSQEQLPLPENMMAVYDLVHLPYTDQLRWRAQRCTVHAAVPEAADAAMPAWQPFDLRRHRQHLHHHLPPTPPTPARPGHTHPLQPPTP